MENIDKIIKDIRSESYVRKEEFIKMLEIIDFEAVKDCDLELITGFIIDDKEGSCQPLYKTIRLY